MIDDENLKRISLILAVIGIIMIYVVTLFIEPQQVSIKDLTENDVGKNVVVNGTIISYSINNENIFIKLTDGTGNITVVMFERTARGQLVYDMKEGGFVSVAGKVNIYKSELEIVANSINKQT